MIILSLQKGEFDSEKENSTQKQ